MNSRAKVDGTRTVPAMMVMKMRLLNNILENEATTRDLGLKGLSFLEN